MSRILITGASKGLGRVTAQELARRGHEVIATARKVETLADADIAMGPVEPEGDEARLVISAANS